MSAHLAGLVSELTLEPSELTLMPAVSATADLFENSARSVYAEAASLILAVDEAAASIPAVPSLLAAMTVLALVRLHSAAPSEDHYRRALRAWGRESARQDPGWAVTYDEMIGEIISAHADMLRVASGPVFGNDDVEGYPPAEEGDELDRAIEEARR